jgi:hypothetical protein
MEVRATPAGLLIDDFYSLSWAWINHAQECIQSGHRSCSE